MRESSARPRTLSLAVLAFAWLVVAAGYWLIPHPPPDSAPVGIDTRPTWPYVWALLRNAESDAGRFGTRFERLNQITTELGPAERELRAEQARTALEHWDQLSPQSRKAAEADILLALSNILEAESVLQTALRHRREAVPCGLWTGGGVVAQACADMHQLRAVCDQPGRNIERERWCFVRGALPRYAR